MTVLKHPILIICILFSFFNSESYAQSVLLNDKTWNSFKESAHAIGFCVYHKQQEVCNKHSGIKQELEKISEPDSDIYYFTIKPSWANKRINDWAKTKESNADNYFILFDIDQKSHKQLYDSTKTSNSYTMFSVFNLKHKYQFKVRKKTDSDVIFYISSNSKNAILSNTMWREFMSNRLGRLDTEIEISLHGTNAVTDYHNFKEAFLKFIEK